MSNNQLIITLIGIAVLLLIAFAVAILLRKRNESRLVALDDCFTAVDSGLAGEIRKDIAALDDLTVIEISNRKPNLEMIPRIKQLEF